MYTHTHTYTCTHKHTHAHTCTHMHMHTHTCTQSHIHTHAHTTPHTHIYNTRAHTHTIYKIDHTQKKFIIHIFDAVASMTMALLSELCPMHLHGCHYPTSNNKQVSQTIAQRVHLILCPPVTSPHPPSL